ncbi:MAG: RNA polymerase sigma factor [Thermoanaerobaculia bacterium]|nr:RNA polymerase sigma factor [Thermoanaerobaculia bacterium]
MTRSTRSIDSTGMARGEGAASEMGFGLRASGKDEDARPRTADPGVDWKAVFSRIAADDTEAFGDLYTLASGSVFGLALWRTGSVQDASEVVQEVFLRLVTDRNRLLAVKAPKAWLLKLTHNVAVDLTRRRGRQRTSRIEDVPFLAAPENDGGRALDAAKASRLLGELPPVQRDVVYLHHFEGYTFAEIGTITGVPGFTAASRYRLGIRKLRRLLEGTA